MTNKVAKGDAMRVIVIAFAAGSVFMVSFSGAVSYTNTTEFCVSCHSQQIPYEEYRKSLHYSNASGVRAGCPDCHVPKSIGLKLAAKLMAVKDVYHEIAGTIDTPEKYEARRWIMANRVWDKMEETDSRECRSCHMDHAMDLSEQDSTAKKKHRRAIKSGDTCISCHKGIVHHLPEEPVELQTGLSQ